MRNRSAAHDEYDFDMESLMSVCCGNPRGDELPQVASEQDLVLDVYSDMLNKPRDYAAGIFHHQLDDGLDFEEMIH